MKAKIAVGKISVSKKAYLGRSDTFCRDVTQIGYFTLLFN